MVQNKIPRVCFYFCSTVQNSELSLLQNGWERSFLVRGKAEIPPEQTNCFVQSVFCRNLPTLPNSGTGPPGYIGCGSVRQLHAMPPYSINLDMEAILTKTTYYARTRGIETHKYSVSAEKSKKLLKYHVKQWKIKKIQEILSWIWGEISANSAMTRGN
jgi:hypothetical protein